MQKVKNEQIENILGHDAFRYLFLVSLISADTLITKDDCLNSLNTFDYIYNNISNMTSLSQEIKDEVLMFVFKGKEIVNKEIERLK